MDHGRRVGQVIGFTGAQPWPQDWGPKGEIEIGWRLGRAYWGQGYATAAAQMTLERLRAAEVPNVVAMVLAGNKRSIAVTRRLGMHLAEVFTTPTREQEGHCYRLICDARLRRAAVAPDHAPRWLLNVVAVKKNATLRVLAGQSYPRYWG